MVRLGEIVKVEVSTAGKRAEIERLKAENQRLRDENARLREERNEAMAGNRVQKIDAIRRYDAMALVASIRWGKIDLPDYELERPARLHLTSILRRVDFMEKKEAQYERPNWRAESEIHALKWAVAFILNAVGKKEAP